MVERIQLSRRKGFRLPDGAKSVARPGPFGNVFTEAGHREAGYKGDWRGPCVEAFREWLTGPGVFGAVEPERRAEILRRIPELRGRDLACWCPLDQPCHADVLLELANGPRANPNQGE